MESSFPSIRFAQDAAENARRNFELVQDKYAQGLVNVTDLLEAQTVSFAADQNAVAATYVFLIDLLTFQRSISWFEYEHTQEERDALLRRIQDAIRE
jgi:outer membrane protein TolC